MILYKAAARNLQRRGRAVRSVKVLPMGARSRAQLRAFWHPVIRHHAEANISVADKYGAAFPSWLEAEVDRLTPARWLAFWDQATDKPKSR